MHFCSAKEAKILERIQEIASVKSEKVISPQTQTTYATPVAARRPRKRTKASASRVALRLYPSRDAHLSEASTSGSSAIEQTSHEASPPMHHLQLHLSQHTQELEQVDIAFDWESLSSYPQTQLDLGFQAIASQPWDQQQYSCFPAYSNDQLVQDPYMKGFFSLPVPVELSTCFDDPALPNILSGVYATGNISAPLPLDIAQPGPALENLFDFMISADVQAESERMVRENPPSPSVLNSLPLIDGQVYPSVWAIPDLQSSSCFVC